MGLYLLNDTMGGGKTLTMVACASMYSKKNPMNPIIANFHLKLPNTDFNPLILIDPKTIRNSLLLIDDIYGLKNRNLIGMVVNMSRKAGLEIFCSAQRYTMFDPTLRDLGWKIDPYLDLPNNTLRIHLWSDGLEDKGWYQWTNVKETLFGLYDTKEIVSFDSEIGIVNEIRKRSSDFDTFANYVNMCFGNQTTIRRILKSYNSENSEKPKAKRSKKTS